MKIIAEHDGGAALPPTDDEIIERLDDWARTLDHAPAFLAKGQYSRIYEAAFRTVADIRQLSARLKGRPSRVRAVQSPAATMRAHLDTFGATEEGQ